MAVNSVESERSYLSHYNHADWERRRRVLRFLIRTIGFTLLARVDKVEGLENVPVHGPAILMINHIAFIDSLVVLHIMPRNIVPLAKIEVYNYPVIGIFPRLWGVIPVQREELDRRAVRQVLDVLRAGEIVLVAPEGTRGTQLSQGKEGVAYFANRSGAPVIPVAIEGTVGMPTVRWSRRWRQPAAHVRIGKPFRFRADLGRPDREMVRKMTDEALYVLAAMLPPARRGYYSDLSKATLDTIESS